MLSSPLHRLLGSHRPSTIFLQIVQPKRLMLCRRWLLIASSFVCGSTNISPTTTSPPVTNSRSARWRRQAWARSPACSWTASIPLAPGPERAGAGRRLVGPIARQAQSLAQRSRTSNSPTSPPTFPFLHRAPNHPRHETCKTDKHPARRLHLHNCAKLVGRARHDDLDHTLCGRRSCQQIEGNFSFVQ